MPPRTTTRTQARQSKPPKPKGPVVKFMGSEYRIAEKMGVWPLMQFARAADSGLSLRDVRGLSAVHAMLENVIHPDDWGTFQDDMVAKKVLDLQALMELVNECVDVLQKAQPASAGNGNGSGELVIES